MFNLILVFEILTLQVQEITNLELQVNNQTHGFYRRNEFSDDFKKSLEWAVRFQQDDSLYKASLASNKKSMA